MTSVVHFNDVSAHWNWRTRKWDSPEFVYIGRRVKTHYLPPSFWGNPIHLHGNSAKAHRDGVDQYRAWITSSDEGRRLIERLPDLRGKTLVCWCAPLDCHGNVFLELLGEKQYVEQPRQTDLNGVQQVNPPLLLWDEGMAGQQTGMNKSGVLYRTSEVIEHPIGLPGKAYLTWEAWYRDFLKETLHVRGGASLSGMDQREYACWRYTTRLAGLLGRDDQRSAMERDILHELMAELEG